MGLDVVPSDCAIGILILPSIKAIIEITTSPSCLSLCHYPSLQYLIPTLGGILYRALKLFIPFSESTKLLNLPIPKGELGALKR